MFMVRPPLDAAGVRLKLRNRVLTPAASRMSTQTPEYITSWLRNSTETRFKEDSRLCMKCVRAASRCIVKTVQK